MTYDVMLTFDLNSAGEPERKKVDDALKELGFEKDWREFDCNFVKNESSSSDDQEHKLPNNTYLSKFKDTDYESKEKLAEYLKESLTEIFNDVNLNGKCVFLIDQTEKTNDINGSAFEF